MLTRQEAIAKLVELDVQKWGEQERAASERIRGELSHGLALNALAVFDLDNIDKQMLADAKRVMTAQDRKALRRGG